MTVDKIIGRLKAEPEIRTKTKIAEICGVTIQAVRCWRRVPAEYCRRLEHATGGKVTRYQMRPDVFGHGPNDDSDLTAA